ncbi:MAG: bifunctional alpha/beta hydrolase/OsmC family protein [Acidobacteriota bacterium]
MASQRVTFPGESVELVGRLDRPTGQVRAWALFAHCFTCGKDLKAARNIARELNRRQIGVLRFDFTGLGESEGDFLDSDFTTNLGDLEQAAAFLREHHAAPQILVGHSLGGAAVLAVANRLPEVRAIATIGAPASTKHLAEKLGAPPERADEEPVPVSLAGKDFHVGNRLLNDLADDHVEREIKLLRRSLLVMHSPIDEIVSVEEARGIFESAKHPKSFVSLDNADHLLTREDDARYAAAVLAAWASRYVDEETQEESTLPGDVVVEIGTRGFTSSVTTAEHQIVADEPRSVGGDDLGPNPYELLLASLGACTVMTLRMYARRKQWPLESAKVTLRHGRMHAKDCEDCVSETGQIDRIDLELSMEGPLDAEQRTRLLEIAHRCPVHRTLTSETKIYVESGD